MHSFFKRYKTYLENIRISRIYKNSTTFLSHTLSQPIRNNPNKEQATIEVIHGDHLAYLYTLSSSNQQNIGVLNNANLYVAGGLYRFGVLAQEESLCYVSNLYSELRKMKKHYFKNWLKCSFYNPSDIFYSKDITVYRDENLERLQQPATIDILSASAVNRRFLLIRNEQKINTIMKNRIRNILETFITEGNKTIILNPFGCGVYGNHLYSVVTLFKEVLIEANDGNRTRDRWLETTDVTTTLHSQNGGGKRIRTSEARRREFYRLSTLTACIYPHMATQARVERALTEPKSVTLPLGYWVILIIGGAYRI